MSASMAVKRRRPDFTDAARLLVQDVALRLEGFEHLQADRILVVAGEARRASRASVKPLTFANGRSEDVLGRKKPVVKVGGKRMLYCITLRPLFFRDSTARERVATLLHELFHISARFDGTLHPARRHATLGVRFQRRLKPIVQRYLDVCPAAVLSAFGYDGEVKVLQWLERPPARLLRGSSTGTRGSRRVYGDDQLFCAHVRMVTPGSSTILTFRGSAALRN